MMLTSCDILSINLSLHWKADDGQGDDPSSYEPFAIEGAATFLSNFSASGKVAIWRETTPQHFSSPDGVYGPDYKGAVGGCVARRDLRTEGPHNTVARAVFDRIAAGLPPLEGDGKTKYRELAKWGGGAGYKSEWYKAIVDQRSLPPPPVRYVLPVNQTAPYRESLHTFWEEQTVNPIVSEFAGRYNGTLDALRERGGLVTSGSVYFWPVHDIFDRFHNWHVGGGDCSHFCFQIGPYDAAIERLALGIVDATSRLAPAATPVAREFVC